MNNDQQPRITGKQLARLFAPYIGQHMQCLSTEIDPGIFRLTSVGEDTCQGTLVSASRNGSTSGSVEGYRLRLNSFKNLDDVTAKRVAKILFPGNDSHILERLSNGRINFSIDSTGSTENPIEFWISPASKKDWFSATHDFSATISLAYQLLQNEGYAIPVFIEDGHADNGKTLFDLGFAIEI